MTKQNTSDLRDAINTLVEMRNKANEIRELMNAIDPSHIDEHRTLSYMVSDLRVAISDSLAQLRQHAEIGQPKKVNPIEQQIIDSMHRLFL